jgi:Protein of unknown function (DUF3102)
MLVCRVILRLQANEVRPCANYVLRGGPSVTIANTLTRNRALAEHVAAIRQRGKRMISDAIEIGRRLKLCKEIVGHGRWLPWLDEQFGWTDRTALNFMRVHTLAAKSEKFSDLALHDLAVPLSSMYALAAPQTPSEAVAEILERARKGRVTIVKYATQSLVIKASTISILTMIPKTTTGSLSTLWPNSLSPTAATMTFKHRVSGESDCQTFLTANRC